MGIEDDAQKVSNTTFSLKDITLIWRYPRCDDVRKGSDPIKTWNGLRGNLREYSILRMPSEATAKLRCLLHKAGHIRDYVKEF